MNDLALVITVQEAAQIFARSEHTIRYHIDKNLIEGQDWRKTGGVYRGVYLISLSALVRLYGAIPPQTVNKLPTK